MRYKESDIAHENGCFWVLKDAKRGRYTVMRATSTHSESESAYRLDADGLSVAIARCDYLATRQAHQSNQGAA